MSDKGKSSPEQKISKSAFWSFGDTVFNQAISLIVSIILARLIEPEAFGVLAVVMVLITVCNNLSISGFGNALVQKKDADSKDFSSVFWFSFTLSILFFFLIWLFSSYVASFYESDSLEWVLRIMALKLPLAAIHSVQHAYCQKIMRFDKLFISSFIANTISAIVGIYMAYSGYEIWALVTQYLTASCLSIIVTTFIIKWYPTLHFSTERLIPLFSYGWKIMLAGMATTITNEIRVLIVGKFFSKDSLAFFERGQRYPQLIAFNISAALTKVLFPAFSKVQDKPGDLKHLVKQTNCVIAQMLFPMMIGIFLVAEPLIIVLLTEKWIAAIPFVQIYAVYCIFHSLSITSWQVLKAIGKSQEYMMLSIIQSVIELLLLFIAIFIFNSLTLVAVGGALSMLFYVVYGANVLQKYVGYSFIEQIRDYSRPILNTVIMGVVIMIIGIIPMSMTCKLILQTVGGALTYFGLGWYFKDEMFTYALSLIKRK